MSGGRKRCPPRACPAQETRSDAGCGGTGPVFQPHATALRKQREGERKVTLDELGDYLGKGGQGADVFVL